MKAIGVVSVAAVACLLGSVAMAEDTSNTFRFDVFYSFPTSDQTVLDATVESDNNIGVDLSYERRVTDVLGMQFGIGYVDYDVKATLPGGSEEDIASVAVMPFYANLLFHPISRTSMIDWYIGPGFSYLNWQDVEYDNAPSSSVDDELTWNARTGIDIKFGEGRFGINLDVQYTHAVAGNGLQYFDGNGDFHTKDFKVEPYNAAVGFTWNF